MDPCVSPEKLEQLLAGTLAEAEAAVARAHVAGCARCQAVLDRLSDHPALRHWAAACGTWPAPDANTPSPAQFLAGLRETLFLPNSLAETPAETQKVGHPFLGTPSDAGDLDTLGPYHILAELGRGGMGIVFKAQDPELARTVALKVLRPECADEAARARFVREARAAAAIDHENVVPVYAVWNPAEGPPYLIMQYVEGPTLRERIAAEHCLAPREAAQIIGQVARGLMAAHSAGLIHRDIKPANIILETARSRAKIVDFGLVRLAAQPGGITQECLLAGTPEYVSPEQIREPGRIDARSDVYSLGVTLYETLTGSVPFRGVAHMVLHQVLHDEPVAPRRLSDSIPRDLETICLKAMAKEPGRRYQTAQEFHDDLQRWLHAEPIRARPVSQWEKLWRWCRRNPLLAFLLLSVGALLMTVAVGASLAAWWLQEEQKATRSQLGRTQQAEQLAQARLYDAFFARARASRWSGRQGQRFDSLDALKEAAQLARTLGKGEEAFRELRQEAIQCLMLPDLRVEHIWEGFPPGTRTVAFDGNLRRYARGDDQGNVSVRRVEDDRELLRLAGVGDLLDVPYLRFSPDGRFLAIRHERRPNLQIDIWDLASRKSILALPGGDEIDFSPDGQRAAITYRDGSVRLHDLNPSQKATDLPLHLTPQGPTVVRFDGTGRRLAVADGRGRELRIWDLAKGQVVCRLLHPGGVSDLSWHPAGRQLATASAWHIFLWNLDTRSKQVLSDGHQGPVMRLAFNHAGDVLASHSQDGILRLWDPQTAQQLIRTPAYRYLQFSPDDRFLAYWQGSRLGILRLARGDEHRLLHGHPQRATAFDFHPNGRLLASAGPDGIRFWDLTTANEIHRLPLAGTNGIVFDPNGKHVVTAGSLGLHRWPIAPALGDAADSLRLGPPQAFRLPAGSLFEFPSVSRDGQTLVVRHGGAQAVLCSMETRRPEIRLTDQVNLWFPALHPDGRWVATGTWHGVEVCIWEAATGKPVHRIPHLFGGCSRVAFSPDGRWLVVSTGDKYDLVEVGSWKPVRRFPVAVPSEVPGPMAFTRDSRVLALADSLTAIKLIDPVSGRVFATLPAPGTEILAWFGFSPAGDRLAVATEAGPVYLWNLRAIGRRLAAIGLDWDLPPAPWKADGDPKPLRIQMDLGFWN